jgi:hypothetical protein
MRAFLILGLCLAMPASAQTAKGQKFTAPKGGECPRPALNYRPGDPAPVKRLNELPPGQVYSAVYHQDGCPRPLVEARGQRRR